MKFFKQRILVVVKRLHFTHKEFKFKNRSQETETKPKGLWYGINDSWMNWCKNEMPNWIPKKPIYYEITLDDRYILFLKSRSDILKFTEEFGQLICQKSELRMIDWTMVAKLYSGIEINPYQWECRLGLETLWYYGWDVSSGCIWDQKGILEITKKGT